MYIPDPIEILEARQDKMEDAFVDEQTCMECGKKVNHELICVDPLGIGPYVCEDCFGMPNVR